MIIYLFLYQVPIGVLTFTRSCLPISDYPDFKNSKKQCRDILILGEGRIEDCEGALQVAR